MTVSTTTSRSILYTHDGVQAVYTFPFFLPEGQEPNVRVVYQGPSASVPTTLSGGFVVTRDSASAGGYITLTDPASVPADSVMRIKRTTPPVQGLRVRNQKKYYPELLEAALDEMVERDQEHDDEFSGVVRTGPLEDTDQYLPSIWMRQGKYAGWDAFGQFTALDPASGSGDTVVTTSGNTPHTHASRWDRVLDVDDWGADPSGTLDSTAAINSVFAAVRAMLKTIVPVGKIWKYEGINVTVRFSRGDYKCLGSINATNLHGLGLVIDGNGATIYSHATGKAAFDMMHCRYPRVNNLVIVGDRTNRPRFGLQIGRGTNLNVSGEQYFDNVKVIGDYDSAALYNYAGETNQFVSCQFTNSRDNPKNTWVTAGDELLLSYAVILDGTNKWGVTSDFMTDPTVGIPQSFNNNTFRMCELSHGDQTGGPCVYQRRAHAMHYTDCYFVSWNSSAVIVDSDGFVQLGLTLDECHFEPGTPGAFGWPGIQHIVFFIGDVFTFDVYNLIIKDHAPHARWSYIATDHSGYDISFYNTKIDMAHGMVGGFVAQHFAYPYTAFSFYGADFNVGGPGAAAQLMATGYWPRFSGKVQIDDRDDMNTGPGNYFILDKVHKNAGFKGAMYFWNGEANNVPAGTLGKDFSDPTITHKVYIAEGYIGIGANRGDPGITPGDLVLFYTGGDGLYDNRVRTIQPQGQDTGRGVWRDTLSNSLKGWVESGVVAAGTTLGTSVRVWDDVVVVTTSVAGVSDSINLFKPILGQTKTISNLSANPIKIFPDVTTSIGTNPAALGTPYVLAATKTTEFVAVTTAHWALVGP